MTRSDDCPLCEREVEGYEPLGGWVYRDEWWSLGVLPGAEVPGWLVLQSRTHVEGLWELDSKACAALGQVLSTATEQLVEAVGAAPVYLCVFGERIPHWHLLLAVPPSDVPEERRGAVLLLDHDDLIDLASASDVVQTVRAGIRQRV